jgi:hypothetical protein
MGFDPRNLGSCPGVVKAIRENPGSPSVKNVNGQSASQVVSAVCDT